MAITDWLLDLAWVLPTGGGYHLTATGLVSLLALGAAEVRLSTTRTYGFCTDNTERRHHLGGDLGAALTRWLVVRDWAARPQEGGRTMLLADAGVVALTGLGVKLPLAR